MEHSKLRALALGLSIVATPWQPAQAGPQFAALQRCLAATAKAQRFSGTVAIGHNGAIVANWNFGRPDPARNRGFSPETRFNIASAGKMFTAVAIGQLVERGLLTFDQSIGQILPNLPPDFRAVTVDQLLTHRAGLGDYLRPENLTTIRSAKTATDLLPIAVRDGLAFPPGAKQQYSSSGYVVLGAIIEKLTGQTYADYVRTHIFIPAGMTSADLEGSLPHATPMTNHNFDGTQSPEPHPAPVIGGDRASPAGGAMVSALDMIKFGEALRYGKILSRRFVDQLWTARVPGPSRDSAKVSYGYGFVRMDFPNGRWLVGHGGGSLGINSEFDLFPATGNTIVSLSNFDPPAATNAMSMARHALLNETPC